MAYTVIRTDLLSGTDVGADLVSLRVLKSEEPVEVENGTIVELEKLEKDNREVWQAKVATAESDASKCAIVASVETMYDERKKNLDEFINEKGAVCRGYIPRSRNIYSVTKEGFVGGTAPEVDGKVGIGEGGKLDTGSTGWGTCIAIEVAGRYTYYVIQLA